MKQKLLNFANRLKSENAVIKEWRKKRPVTPLSDMLQRIFCSVWIISLVLFAIFSPVSASADDRAAAPTNLSGYTVTVPAGWSCPDGYGFFNLNGTIYGFGFTSIGVGYSGGDFEMGDYIEFMGEGGYYRSFNPSDDLIFNVEDGYDVTNIDLIEWAVDNNATFVSSTPPVTTVTFDAGLYSLDSLWYNTTISTQLDGMNFKNLDGEEFIALTVQNNQLIADDLNGEMRIIATYDGSTVTWLDNSFRYIYYLNDEQIPSSLADSLPSLIDYHSDITLSQFEIYLGDSYYYGVTDGFDVGYDTGYHEGYEEGVGISPSEGDTFLGNIVANILDALDQFTIVGSFSYLDLIKVLIAAFVLLFFLKLLAGG